MLESDKAENYINDDIEQDFEKNNLPKNDNEMTAQGGNKFFDILKAKTGEGSINDYNDHPLNFSNNKYISQILRGLTGMLGALDLAIIDISMGILGLVKDRTIAKNIEVVNDNV